MTRRQTPSELFRILWPRLEAAFAEGEAREKELIAANRVLQGKLIAYGRGVAPAPKPVRSNEKELEREYLVGLRDGRTEMLRRVLQFSTIAEMLFITEVAKRTHAAEPRTPEQIELANKIIAEAHALMDGIGMPRDTVSDFEDDE